MDLDFSALAATDVYRFMISAVVPRPIAWVSTRDAGGGTNLAPFSYFVPLSSAPPLVGIAILEREGDPKDTLRNIRESGEFVINVVSEPLLDAMVTSAGDWPRGTSEFERARVTPAPAAGVAAPCVAEAPIHLACRLEREIPFGGTTFVVGRVLGAHVDDGVLTDGRVDATKLQPVGRMGGEFYMPFRELAKVPRPRVSRATGETLG